MTKPIIRQTETYLTPTPEELADCLWSMDGDQQAKFFNRLGSIARDKFPMQLEFISSSKELSSTGQNTMWQIGCYGAVR